ncbi:MAG TPA: mannitol dehydrogenase family protein [Xanthobacteraceae bacterium]|nr:mannitol dehydrogenase family protein [Xanthobacteraceae bacterium]
MASQAAEPQRERPDPRLSLARLRDLPAAIVRPAYDVRKVACGILHLGIGAFHRAHQAFYTDTALADGGAWGIIGASLRGAGVRDRLAPQGCLYTLVEKGAAGARYRIIGAVREVVFATDDPRRLPALIADPRMRIVSLTVTEKGYCHDPASGRLNPTHPDIVHDLAHPDQPSSAIGILAAGLRRRFRQGGAPLTLLSCDNLPENGRTLARIVLEFAARLDREAARFIEREVAFPCTMVDRIVPAATDALIAETSAALGVADAAPVQCEPFSQWVIEDRFAAGRPAWERAGAELVADVAPYEEMKLRLLNGSHSMLAYLGFLGGFEYIWQVMREPDYVALMRNMMQEVQPRLALDGRYDLAAYQQTLVERFSNPALLHRCYQIAMDGSQKLPQRLLGTIRANLAAGLPIRRLALAVAAWMRYVAGVDEEGKRIVVQDPLADTLARAAAAGGDARAMVDNLLAVRAVFGDDLPQSATFRDDVGGALAALLAEGARATVRRYA